MPFAGAVGGVADRLPNHQLMVHFLLFQSSGEKRTKIELWRKIVPFFFFFFFGGTRSLFPDLGQLSRSALPVESDPGRLPCREPPTFSFFPCFFPPAESANRESSSSAARTRQNIHDPLLPEEKSKLGDDGAAHFMRFAARADGKTNRRHNSATTQNPPIWIWLVKIRPSLL